MLVPRSDGEEGAEGEEVCQEDEEESESAEEVGGMGEEPKYEVEDGRSGGTPDFRQYILYIVSWSFNQKLVARKAPLADQNSPLREMLLGMVPLLSLES